MPLACRHGLLADQVVGLDDLHQDDDPVRNLDKTLREEEPDDTAVPEGAIDGDADAAADSEQVVRKRSTAISTRTKDVEKQKGKVDACAAKMHAAAAGKPQEVATARWAKSTEKLRVAVAALEGTRKALAEKVEAKEAKEESKKSLKKNFVWSDEQLEALAQIVLNDKSLTDSVNSSTAAWESIAQAFNALCAASLWDTPPDGFKTAALIGKYNEIKNKFFAYCRAKQFGGESGDAGYVDSARQAAVESSFHPVFKLFIEANMQNKAAAVPPFTISGSGTTGNELVKNGATGMRVDLVLLRHGGTHGKDSEGRDTKYRPDRPRFTLKRARTIAPPEDDCVDDTLPIECFDSAPSSQEPVNEPVKKKPKKATVVAAMAAAQDPSDQKFIDAIQAAAQFQSDQLTKMIAPST